MSVEDCEFQKRQFIVVELSQSGAGSFSCFEDAATGQEEIFFIDDIFVGCVTSAIRLSGDFLLVTELEPSDTLAFNPSHTKQLLYHGDKRIVTYRQLMADERARARSRLEVLGEKNPEHRVKIAELLKVL